MSGSGKRMSVPIERAAVLKTSEVEGYTYSQSGYGEHEGPKWGETSWKTQHVRVIQNITLGRLGEDLPLAVAYDHPAFFPIERRDSGDGYFFLEINFRCILIHLKFETGASTSLVGNCKLWLSRIQNQRRWLMNAVGILYASFNNTKLELGRMIEKKLPAPRVATGHGGEAGQRIQSSGLRNTYTTNQPTFMKILRLYIKFEKKSQIDWGLCTSTLWRALTKVGTWERRGKNWNKKYIWYIHQNIWFNFEFMNASIKTNMSRKRSFSKWYARRMRS